MNPQPLSPQAPTMPSANPLIGSQQPAPMPQLILASGHLIQGIQGAQLLIPTSQGNQDLELILLSVFRIIVKQD